MGHVTEVWEDRSNKLSQRGSQKERYRGKAMEKEMKVDEDTWRWGVCSTHSKRPKDWRKRYDTDGGDYLICCVSARLAQSEKGGAGKNRESAHSCILEN